MPLALPNIFTRGGKLQLQFCLSPWPDLHTLIFGTTYDCQLNGSQGRWPRNFQHSPRTLAFLHSRFATVASLAISTDVTRLFPQKYMHFLKKKTSPMLNVDLGNAILQFFFARAQRRRMTLIVIVVAVCSERAHILDAPFGQKVVQPKMCNSAQQ